MTETSLKALEWHIAHERPISEDRVRALIDEYRALKTVAKKYRDVPAVIATEEQR